MIKTKIRNTIRNFDRDDFFDAAVRLFHILGYDTARQMRIDHPAFSESYLEENDSIPDIGKFDKSEPQIQIQETSLLQYYA